MWLSELLGRIRGGRDGSSPENAVVVSSVAEEYEWMDRHLSGFQRVMQFIEKIEEQPYDVHLLQNDRGEERRVYFDISRFYGCL